MLDSPSCAGFCIPTFFLKRSGLASVRIESILPINNVCRRSRAHHGLVGVV